MKNAIILALLVCTVLSTGIGRCFADDKNKDKAAATIVIIDPQYLPLLKPKPPGLTNPATLGIPEVVFEGNAKKAASNPEGAISEVSTWLAGRLSNCGRFDLVEKQEPQFTFKILVNNFEINQETNKKTSPFGKFLENAAKGMKSAETLLNKGGTNVTAVIDTIDFSQVGITLKVKCSVTIQFGGADHKLDVEHGGYDRTVTVDTVALEIEGINLATEKVPGSAQQMPTNGFAFQCDVLEITMFKALEKIMDRVDRRVMNPPVVVAKAEVVEEKVKTTLIKEVPAPVNPTPPAIAETHHGEPLLCPYCKKPVEAEFKICPECSTPIKFCVKCKRPLKIEWKHCPVCLASQPPI